MPNFTYTQNIPAANNDPSVDQPNMETNTNSTSSILSVDMIGFNNNNGGYHSKVTLIDQLSALVNPGTVPESGVLYSNSTGAAPFNSDADPQLYYKTLAAVQKLTGNLIISSGTLTPGGSGSYTVFQTPWNLKIFCGITPPNNFATNPQTFTMTGGTNLGSTVYTAQISVASGVTSVNASAITPNAGANTFAIKINGSGTPQFYFLIITN